MSLVSYGQKITPWYIEDQELIVSVFNILTVEWSKLYTEFREASLKVKTIIKSSLVYFFPVYYVHLPEPLFGPKADIVIFLWKNRAVRVTMNCQHPMAFTARQKMVIVVVSLPLAGASPRALWMHFSPVVCLLGGLWGSAAVYTLLCHTKEYCFPFDLGSTRTLPPAVWQCCPSQ